MIKIEPLFASDYAQVRGLLKHQPDFEPAEHLCSAGSFFFRGLTFWQHWLPCRMHIGPSVYVAREDGIILGLIALRSVGKSKDCWAVDHLITHPHHRGRGIAQELLRYSFAQFGSQGVSHFISEVSDQNSAALSLFGSCGFRRCAKITSYRIVLSPQPAQVIPELPFRLATSADRHALFQLHQEVLPPDIRLVFSYVPEDFAVQEPHFEAVGRVRERLNSRKVWYWVLEDPERKILTCAAKVTAHGQGDYHLEFAVHPGWRDHASDLVAFCLHKLAPGNLDVPVAGQAIPPPKGSAQVTAKSFDFDSVVIEALQAQKMERTGGFCLLAREHWTRARQPHKVTERPVGIPAIPNPAINLPLATD